MRRRLVAIIGAIALATTGTFVLVAYVNTAEDRALAGERTVEVLVVAKTVDRGTAAAELDGRVEVERVPAKVRASDAVSDLDDLGDKVAAVDLMPGEQLLTSRFVERTDLQAVGQAGIQDGFQQVTISLTPDRAVGGKLQPGSTVAVVASFDQAASGGGAEAPTPSSEMSHMLLRKVVVSNVQITQQAETADESQQVPVDNLLVTLALEPGDVEKVVFAAEHGSIWLSIDPEDAPESGTTIQTKEQIFR